MTLRELQTKLGETILKVENSENAPRETQTKILDSAMAVSSLAKQMINNADVILRAEKLEADGKLISGSATLEIVR